MVRIRRIERSDLDKLFALDQACFRPGIAYTKSDLHYFVRHPHSLSYGAVDQSGELVGFAIAEFYLEGGRRFGHIVTIDVDPAVRRRGIGRLLMQAVMDGLYALQAVAVRLEVAVDNRAAQLLYEQFGFTRTGRIPGFYMGTLDALSMHKPLEQADAQAPTAAGTVT